ncbi:MAG: cation-translocating P-type ATPase [Myxococcota bacterium]
MRRVVPDDRAALLAWPPTRGLSLAEVSERLARYGANDVLEERRSAWRELARGAAGDPMLWFLLAMGIAYALLGERAEAITLLVSIAPLIGMDAVLQRRTQASTAGLRSRLAESASALRGGETRDVPARELVPGDLVFVHAGESFPADGLVVAGAELQADESLLTGEAYPVRKSPLARTHGLALAGEHWASAGTRLLAGGATLRVIHTGAETLYGGIARSARLEVHAQTPLQLAVGSLVRVLLGAALVLCAALAWVRIRQGFGWGDALVSAATLAVAALPEEFPVIFAAFLGVGVHRLARRKALVRRAVSVENIGRVTCICSDKTGTITLGELRLAHLLPAPASSDSRLVELAATASRAESSDPLDEAVQRAAAERALAAASPRVALFPFTEDRRRETAVVHAPDSQLLAVSKGAPELLLALCALGDAERAAWRARTAELAAQGHKVIACATRAFSNAAWAGGEPDRGLQFEGLLAFEDPVRAGVAEAVAQCRAAGIRVLMVTGDHRATACAVAREIGLRNEPEYVAAGEELESLLAPASAARLARIEVVARALPAQKLALVRALQAGGAVVAVTGDGVNDVPALQVADVGIAMGERGTRSAREVAAIVLLDDCFETIVRAIAEGRQLFRNLQLAFSYLLMIHIPLVITAALIPLAGAPLLYLPIHIVWLELVIHPSALIAFQEPPAEARLGRVHDGPTRRFFSRAEWVSIALVGGLITALVALAYDRALGAGGDVLHGRAMALVALNVASAGVTASLSGLRTRAAAVVCAATLALAVVLVQVAPLAARLHVSPLHLDDWALAVAGGALACLPLWLGTALSARASERESARVG